MLGPTLVLGEEGSRDITTLLPREPQPGDWYHCATDRPIAAQQLDDAINAGWSMKSMVPYIDTNGLTYIIYFQYNPFEFARKAG